jgi:hypothetical protein
MQWLHFGRFLLLYLGFYPLYKTPRNIITYLCEGHFSVAIRGALVYYSLGLRPKTLELKILKLKPKNLKPKNYLNPYITSLG